MNNLQELAEARKRVGLATVFRASSSSMHDCTTAVGVKS
jgi:hypothetical protein